MLFLMASINLEARSSLASLVVLPDEALHSDLCCPSIQSRCTADILMRTHYIAKHTAHSGYSIAILF